jgi:hypothetical protein
LLSGSYHPPPRFDSESEMNARVGRCSSGLPTQVVPGMEWGVLGGVSNRAHFKPYHA